MLIFSHYLTKRIYVTASTLTSRDAVKSTLLFSGVAFLLTLSNRHLQGFSTFEFIYLEWFPILVAAVFAFRFASSFFFGSYFFSCARDQTNRFHTASSFNENQSPCFNRCYCWRCHYHTSLPTNVHPRRFCSSLCSRWSDGHLDCCGLAPCQTI